MGAAASIDFSNFHNLSTQDVARYVASLGKDYENYSKCFIENGIDGACISAVDEGDISDLLSGIGITSIVHKTKLKGEILKLKKNLLRIESVTELPKHEESMPGKFETVPDKYFVFGDHKDYMSGLTQKIETLYCSMEEECTKNDNGKWKADYDYVVYQKAEEKTMDANNPWNVRDLDHNGMTLEDFCKHEKASSSDLELKLSQAEVAALRLYTGPFYQPWNTALRFYKESPLLLESWGTCISVLYSAILKLSFVSKSVQVFRGVNESVSKLPEDFLKGNKEGYNGGVELAFMSTSTDIAIASEYSKGGAESQCVIFEIAFDGASRAADVQWVSQYPYEKEFLYPPCTYITCEKVELKTNSEGVQVKHITAKLTVSTARRDIEKLGILTVHDYDRSAHPKKRMSISDQKRSELLDFQDMELSVEVVLGKGYNIPEITSIENWYSVEDFIQAGCTWKDLYGSNCFTTEALKNAISYFITTGCSWNDLQSANCFTLSELKLVGCPGYVLRQSGTSKKQLVEIGYENKDIFTVQEMMQDFKKSIKECYNMGYSCAQMRNEGLEIKTKWSCIQTLKGHTDDVKSVIALPDGKSLASGSGDKSIKIWDMKTGSCIHTLEGHTGFVYSVIALPDGKSLASGSGDKSIKIWDVKTGSCIHTLEGHTHDVKYVMALPDGKSLVSGTHKSIKIWDVETGSCIHTLEGHTHEVKSVIVLPDGKSLASGSGDNSIKIWDIKTGSCIHTLEGHTGSVDSVIALPDGKSLVSRSGDNSIKIWDIKTGSCIHTLEGHTGFVYSVIALPDGKSLASGSGDKSIKIWDMKTGSCIHTLEGHTGIVYSVMALPDGKSLVSRSDNRSIKIWDVKTGSCIHTLEGHTGFVYSVMALPDGKSLVSRSGDKSIKIWDVKTGSCIHTLEGHNDIVYSVMVLPDGQSLVSRSGDNSIKIWEESLV